MLITEPGGAYKAVLADSVIGHRVARGADAFQASADVTELVRTSGSVRTRWPRSMWRSAAGAWGGWTLMAAYRKKSEPLPHLAMWDGFDTLGPGEDQVIRLRRLPFPENAGGRVGLVAAPVPVPRVRGGELRAARRAAAPGQGVEARHGEPIPVEMFVWYGLRFARNAVPDVDERTVVRVQGCSGGFEAVTEDGAMLRRWPVALAVGVLPFVEVPATLRDLSPS